MKALEELNQLKENTKQLLASTSLRGRGPFSIEQQNVLNNLAFEIKDRFSPDYCNPILIKDNEAEILEEMVHKYLMTGKDEFDDKYIHLLAWNIHDLKLFPKIITKEKISLLEYEPSYLNLNPATKKIFKLFLNHMNYSKRIASALMMVYLNNYSVASEFFIFQLKKYLKQVKFTKNINLYFDVNGVWRYANWRKIFIPHKSFIRRLKSLHVRSSFWQTNYFKDAWYFWMKNNANTCDNTILEDLPCRFFEVCSDAEKLFLLSRIIIDNNTKGKDVKIVYENYLSELFPVNPLIPENWLFQCSLSDMYKLIKASNIIQRLYVSKPRQLTIKLNLEKIEIIEI